MWIYLLLYFWSILSSILINRKRDIGNIFYLYLNIIPLILIATFRSDNVGTDLPMYIDFFNSVKDDFCFLDTRMEPGYVALNYLSSYFSDSSVCLLFLVSCITYICIFYCFYRCSSNAAVSVIVLIGLYLYCESFNVIRQYLAIAFICISYSFFYFEKIRKAYLFCLFAILFHKTAIVMLPIMIIFSYVDNFKKYMMVFFGVVIAYFLAVLGFDMLLGVLSQYSLQYSTSHYIQSREFTASIILPFVTLMVIAFLNINMYKKREIFFDKKLAFLNIMLLLYSLSWIASFKVYIYYRFVYYFEIFLCFAIPYVVEGFFKSKNAMYFVTYLMMSIYLFLHLSKNTALVVPYGISF